MLKPTAFLIGTLVLVGVAMATPPSHAPAHGWRKKNDPAYVGYTGTAWERDYGVSSGHCNREEIGAVLGGAAGAVIGSRTSDEHRTVATILGAAAGALIGAAIGRDMDEGDRGCLGHALEIGKPGQRITWTNTRTGVNYVLIPDAGTKSNGKSCRGFVLMGTLKGKKEERRAKACQSSAGQWDLS
jgi:surface antigen